MVEVAWSIVSINDGNYLFNKQPRNVEVKLILEASNGGLENKTERYLYPNFKILSILHTTEIVLVVICLIDTL